MAIIAGIEYCISNFRMGSVPSSVAAPTLFVIVVILIFGMQK